MNIHEHQAKAILKEFGAPVPNGVTIYNIEEISKKIKSIKIGNLVIKAQIHAGGRGKAGGIKLVKTEKDLIRETKKMFGKTLITHQTGLQGKKVQRVYIEEVSNIKKEFYLACLVDRSSSKIAFISSTEGGTEIEEVAKNKPNKILTKKINLTSELDQNDIKEIIKPFALPEKIEKQAIEIVQSIYKILIKKDASLIEINPLVLTQKKDLVCLDA